MPASEAVLRAKKKYYEKMKENPEYKEKNKARTKAYYDKHKEEQKEKCKAYYENNKEKLSIEAKEKREKKILNSVIQQLEKVNIEELAKILIDKKKAKSF
mmetsp:Transcript_84829/g.226361  ORF Transcript_84829/g.226361 Transcript_84829/m.226361 type:complete len:100 (+) Transcript_84829:705-1004(+)